MSLKDKASKIDFASLPGAAVPAAPVELGAPGARPKTAPGLLMAHAADQRSELLRENESLRAQVSELADASARAAELQDELKAWDGAKATRLIDPKLIVRSRWANRDERHFQTTEFQQLKAEIASAGGNVQPIKVRSLPAFDGQEAKYEVVFGHRRLEACRQLGLPVVALIDNVDDRGLFVEMDRENRSRKDLSAWEQGVMYRRALAEGLFPSNRKLAEAVGADLTNVGRALALADLPKEVVDAFPSPMELQFRWARPLGDALDRDPEGVRRRAAELAAASPKLNAKAVFDLLVADDGQGGSTVLPPPPPVEIQVAGRRAAVVRVDAHGGAKITIEPGAVPASKLSDLAGLIENFLTARRGKSR